MEEILEKDISANESELRIFQIKTYMLQNDSKKYLAGAYVDF